MKKIFTLLFLVSLVSFFSGKVNAQYCSPTYSSGCSGGDSLTAFQVGTFYDYPGCGSGATGYDTSGLLKTIKLLRGNSYQVAAKVGTGSSTNMNFAVYIDYNQDGDFKDAGEMVIVDNNRTDTLNVFFTVPLNVKTGKTRLRIVTDMNGSINWLNDSSACWTTLSSGETEDYTVEIKSPRKDAQVIAILSPVNYTCASKSQSVSVIVRNNGLDTLNNLQVGLNVSGAASLSATDTVLTRLGYGQVDTFTFTTTLNTSTGGSYKMNAYTKLPSDTNLNNDSFSLSALIFPTPATPKVTNGLTCLNNTSVDIYGYSSTAKTKTYWYASATSDTLLGVGDTFTTAKLTSSKTYFAQSQYNLTDTLGTNFSGGRANWGNMFDVVAKSTITVDSFDVATTSTTSVTVRIYYRVGSYVGNETKPAAWKLLGTTTVTGNGTGNPTMVKIGNLHMKAGTRYGIYVHYTNGAVASYDFGSNHYVGNDMDIFTGCSLGGLFSGGVVPVRNWNGRLYYHIQTCPSARVAVKADVSKIFRNFVFNSSCKGIPVTFSDSATVNVGKITSRQWTFGDPGSGSANKDTGVAPKHTYINAGAYSVKLVWTTSAGCKDSLTLAVAVTGAASTSFTYKNKACKDEIVSFINTTTGTGTLNYLWDFGDGTPTTNTQNAAHAYATTGTYKVVLRVGSGTCYDYDTQSITIIGLPSVKVSAWGCDKDYVATVSPVKLHTIQWGDNTSDTSSKAAIKHSYASSGTYQIIALYTDTSTKCTGRDSVSVVTMAKPVSKFLAMDSTCYPNSIKFSNASSGTASKYAWSYGDGNTGINVDSTYTYSKAGTYKVMLVAMNTENCPDTFSKTITILPAPSAAFGFIKQGGRKVDFKATDTTQNKYDWDFGDVSAGTGYSTSHTYTANGLYTIKLKVTSKDNCMATDSAAINVQITGVANNVSGYGVSIYPNPSHDAAVLTYSLTSEEKVSIIITDISGRILTTSQSTIMSAGIHQHSINTSGNKMAPGIYLAKVDIGGENIVKQLVILP